MSCPPSPPVPRTPSHSLPPSAPFTHPPTPTPPHPTPTLSDLNFRLYDYGSAAENLRQYGSPRPPSIADNYRLLDIPVDLVSGVAATCVAASPQPLVHVHVFRNAASQHTCFPNMCACASLPTPFHVLQWHGSSLPSLPFQSWLVACVLYRVPTRVLLTNAGWWRCRRHHQRRRRAHSLRAHAGRWGADDIPCDVLW